MLRGNKNLFFVLCIIMAIQLAACSESEDPPKVEPAIVEQVEGSEFNRVILTERASERLGIVTEAVQVRESQSTLTVEGRVVTQEDPANVPGEDLVRVAIDKNTLSKLDRSQPARIVLQADDEDEDGFLADLFEPPEIGNDDEDDDEETLYLMLENSRQNLSDGQSVFVALALAEGESRRSVIPYSAVIYGLNGETWTYVNSEPLTFMRHPILIDYIEGGQAFLNDGPTIGTRVVSIGAQMLYGADTGVGK